MKVVCFNCECEFDKPEKERKRAERSGRKNFCSRSCSASYGNKKFPRLGNAARLIAGNRRDDLSPFRLHFRCAARRSKESGFEFSITIEDVKAQWEKQNGICPYTGWNLVNVETSRQKLDKSPNKASLDRSESSIGYVPGNIQFVAMMANFAKNNFSSAQLVEFCRAVTANKA